MKAPTGKGIVQWTKLAMRIREMESKQSEKRRERAAGNAGGTGYAGDEAEVRTVSENELKNIMVDRRVKDN